MSCVSPTIKQMQQFKELQHKYDLHETTLESIVHEWINIEGNENTFPSDSFIQERIQGKPTMNASEAQIELWNKYYSTPIVVDTMEEAVNIQDASSEYFDDASIKVIRTEDGKYKISVAEPLDSNGYNSEMRSIKEKAIADGTFMKAPNGNPTNLTERQWLQVRTKAFKDWFGDWINNPQNASKVVDENGEPLQVYHHTDNPNLIEFSTDFENYFAKDGGTKEAVFFDENKTGTLNRKYDIPVFLNIRELNEYNETKQQLHDRGTTYREVVNQSAEKNNKDGGVHMKDFDDNKMEHQSIWIVHNPNQIKSATDNVGTFSNDINNIYENRGELISISKVIDNAEKALQESSPRNSDKEQNKIINEANEQIHRMYPDLNLAHNTFFELKETSGLDALRRLSDMEGSLTQNEMVELRDMLSSKFGTQFKLASVSKSRLAELSGNDNTNCMIRKEGNDYVIYFGNVILPTYAQLAEELLHPLVYTFQSQNPELFNSFLDEVNKSDDEAIQAIANRVERLYRDKDVYTRSNEKVTQVLAFMMNEANIDKYNDSSALGSIFRRVIDWLYRLFSSSKIKDIQPTNQLNLKNLAYLLKFENIRFELASMQEGMQYENKEEQQPTETLQSTKKKLNPLQQKFMDYQTRFLQQMDNLTNFVDERLKKLGMDGRLTKKMVQEFSEDVGYMMSDFITWCLNGKPENGGINKNFLFDTFEIADTQELRDRLPNMSRLEMVNLIGIDNLINAVRKYACDGSQYTMYNLGFIGKLNENWDAVMRMASFVFNSNEDFSILLVSDKKTVKEKGVGENVEVDDFNAMDNSQVREEVDDVREHWQIDSNTRDIVTDLKKDVKDAISQSIEVSNQGQPIVNYWGKPKRVELRSAVKQIINATQGCGNINEMVAMLKENRDNMPWIDDILRRLDDTTGSETIFQSNFYRTFKKKKASYNSTYNDGGVLTNIIMNASKASREILKAAQNLKKAGEHPLFTNRGINESLFKRLKDVSDKLNEFVSSNEGDANSLIKQAVEMLLGSVEESEKITDFENTGVLLSEKDIENMSIQLAYIVNTLEKKVEEKDINYDPFEYIKQQEGVEQKDYGIRSNLTKFIAPLTAKMASLSIDTVYNNGKTYQTNVTPSWLDLFLDAMHSPDKLQMLIDTKFGISEWFANADGTFRNTWLDVFTSFPEEYQKKLLQHHIDLDYNGKRYMKEMTPEDYLMSTITNYFREVATDKKSQIAWFPLPTIGNKPSNEFISFLRYAGFSRESIGVNWYNGNDVYSENDVLVVFEREDGANLSENTTNILRQRAVGNYAKNNISRNEMGQSLITKLIEKAGKHPDKIYKLVNLENSLFSHQDMVRKILSEYPEIKRVPNIQFNSKDIVGLLGYGQKKVIEGMVKCFDQEMSRIQTCLMRQQEGIKKGDSRFIKSWDDRGRSFCFLPEFNKYLTTDGLTSDSDIRFANIIKARLEGKKDQISSADQTWFKNELESRLALWMDNKTINILSKWKNDGIFNAASKIKGISDNAVERMQQLSEFIWNNTLAQINMTQLFAIDKAFFKNEEDLQKRMPQIHAPGERVNTQAVVFDTKNNSYSVDGRVSADGKLRTTILKDFDNVVSTIKDNVAEVFERKLKSYKEGTREYAMAEKVFNNIVSSFDKINVADAQAYVSLTGIRKIGYMTGNWDTAKESVYQKIQRNEYDYNDLIALSEVIKPFAFDQILESTRVSNAPIKQIPVPIQQKNSVYLITMAGAILSNEQTTKPNILKVLERIMEESAYDNRKYDKNGNIVEQGKYNGKGIDIIQFESAIKVGLEGTTNLNEFVNGENVRDSENGAYKSLKSRMYNIDGEGRLQINPNSYNDSFVRATNFDNWCIQQEVSDHFNDHEQIDGSQQRAIIPSDLEDTYLGNPVSYAFEEKGETKSLNAKEFKHHWEKVQARNIELSFQELKEEFALEGDNIDINIALSELLQNEIMNNLQRYGLDLLNAVSLDENFKFRLPLGDPIMSKRIEQLLNAMIKNRINKQMVDGGPVVQVSNFGTSKELNIIFNDINGNRLKTFNEWKESENRTDEDGYKQYLKENQGGISYMEVFVSIFDDRLKKFMDENGVIDINKIKERFGEKTVDEMMTMLGYRIPTEDKYSIIPMKVVGFLPAESGSAIMMSNDITLLTGSDFDVDKMYLKRKSYNWGTDYKALRNRLFDFIKGNFKTLENKEIAEMVNKFLENPEANKDVDVWSKAMYKIYKTEDFDRIRISDTGRKGNNNTIINMSLSVLQNPSTLDKMLNPGNFEPEKRLGYMINAFKHSNKSWEELQTMDIDDIKALNKTPKDLSWIDTMVDFYAQNKAASTALGMAAVQKSAHAILEGDGLCITTSNALSAYPTRSLDKRNFEFILGRTITTDDFNTFISLMQSDVNKEASLEEAKSKYPELYDIYRKYTIDNEQMLPVLRIGDNIISGAMEIDKKLSNDGVTLIGRTLGEFVGMFADAVKDPVANLMNINNQTMPVVTTMIRLGISLEDTSLFIAQNAVSKLLERMSLQSIQGNSKSLTSTIRNRIKELENSLGKSVDGLKYESITKQELISGLRKGNDFLEYKILNALLGLVNISNEMKSVTLVTRLNSISSAAGPLIIDNLIMQKKFNNFTAQLANTSDLYAQPEQLHIKDVLDMHPMLKAFSQVYMMNENNLEPLVEKMFDYSPLMKGGVFYDAIDSWGSERNIDLFQNRTMLNKIADFYLSMMAYVSGAISTKKSPEYYITKFPKEFFDANYKTKYKDNAFIQATMRNMEKLDNNGNERLIIKIDYAGLDESVKEKLRNGWSDLAFENPELAYDLFCYAFYKGGMGFNPKSFMSLLPENLRRQYYQITVNDTQERLYDSPMRVSSNQLVRTFLQNNAQDASIVRIFNDFDGESIGTTADGTELFATNSEELKGVMAFNDSKTPNEIYVLSDMKMEDDYSYTIFEKVPVLGNYGEFMEFSKNPEESGIFANDNPIARTNEAKETNEVIESESSQVESNEEQQLSLFSEEETIDLTSSIAKELNIIENNEENDNLTIGQKADMIHKTLTEQGMNITKEEVEETIQKLNIC